MGKIYTIKKKIGARHRTSVDGEKIACVVIRFSIPTVVTTVCHYYRMTTVVTTVATHHGITTILKDS